MKILPIFLGLIVIVYCDFPSDPVKAAMFDVTNSFIDDMNKYIFSLNGLLQSNFDAAVAGIWVYWRQASFHANLRAFVTASDNRTALQDCIGSLDDVISKVVSHLTNDVMKPIFDVRDTVTKIEDDLSKEFDQIKDLIMTVSNVTCLKKVNYNDYSIRLNYYKYITFLSREFSSITYKTQADYNARVGIEQASLVLLIFGIRSSIMLAKTRNDFNLFINKYCKPEVFSRFEEFIVTSDNVVKDCAKKIYNALNEALSEIPNPSPFKNQIAICL